MGAPAFAGEKGDKERKIHLARTELAYASTEREQGFARHSMAVPPVSLSIQCSFHRIRWRPTLAAGAAEAHTSGPGYCYIGVDGCMVE